MKISIKADVKEATKYLDKLQKKHIPFAIMLALNKTVKDTFPEVAERSKNHLSIKKAYLLKQAYYVGKATKTNLSASIRVKDRQWEMLKPHILGGKRKKKRSEDILGYYYAPAFQRKKGVSGAEIQKILSDLALSRDSRQNTKQGTAARYFVMRRDETRTRGRDKPMIWERSGKNINPVLSAISDPSYNKVFPLTEIQTELARKYFKTNMEKKLRYALMTARENQR